MLNNDQVIRLFTLLISTRGNDRWSLKRIAHYLGVNANTTSEKNALRYQIRKLRKRVELEYLANTGTGYFIPEFEDEYEEVSRAFRNRANGLAETANKFKLGSIKANNMKREHEQLSLDFDNVNEQ